MSRKPVVSIIAALCILLLTGSLQAQQPVEPEWPDPKPVRPQKKAEIGETVAELEEKSKQAHADGKYLRFYVANMKLHQLRPYEPSYMENIVAASALVNCNTAPFEEE